ncbi:hypothetical protein Tco_1323073, partial [Tanacetum coccineum]
MAKSLANHLYLKSKLYTFHMHLGKSQSKHIDEFHKLYGRDTLKLEDVLATLNSREFQKMTEAKGDGGEGLYVRGRSGQNRYGAGNEDQVFGSGADGYDNADVMMAMSGMPYTRDKKGLSTDDGWVKFHVGQHQAVTKKTLKGRKQLGEYQTGWKIKTGNVLDFFNQRSTQQCTKSVVAKHLGVAIIQQQNGLVKETNVTLLAKVRCFLIQSGTSSVQVLQGVEFEVEPHEDHTFEVEPHGNVDHVVGSQEVQTQDLIYYHPARDREQHSVWELFSIEKTVMRLLLQLLQWRR